MIYVDGKSSDQTRAPSRRNVVKGSVAAAVSPPPSFQSVPPLPQRAPAASRAPFMRTARAVSAARPAIQVLPAFWCRMVLRSLEPMLPDATRFRSRTRASFSSLNRPAMPRRSMADATAILLYSSAGGLAAKSQSALSRH